MNVEFNMNSYGEWYWIIPNEAEGTRTYTRRSDARRGFERFCTHLRKEEPTPAEEAAERLGFERFDYAERS